MTTRYAVVLSMLAQEKFDRFIRASRKQGIQIAKAIERLALGIEHARLLIYVITIDDRKNVYR